eukprot:1144703-Pelagomonas_calceolata.AAC.5
MAHNFHAFMVDITMHLSHAYVQVDIMARDALDSSAPQLQQAVALHALAALVAAGAASPSALPTTTPAAGLVAGSSAGGSLAGASHALEVTTMCPQCEPHCVHSMNHNVPEYDQMCPQGHHSVPTIYSRRPHDVATVCPRLHACSQRMP